MIFHTKRTITIGQFSELVTFNDTSLIKRVNIWIPKRILNTKLRALVTEFNRLINKREIDKLISKDIHRLSMINRINIQYPSLLKLIDLTAKYKLLGVGSEEEYDKLKYILKTAYKRVYNREPNKESDYIKVAKDYERLRKKYKQMYPDEETKDVKQLDVEELIVTIESAIAPVTIRDKKLYALPKYLELVTKKTEQNGKV